VARIRRVTRVCDLPHDSEVSGDRALFVIADRIYTIDACAAHKAELRAAVDLVIRALAAHWATVRKQQGTRNRPRQRLWPGR
jgi:hypothetical protein